MFRAASVFVPEFVVLRWLRRSITFFFGFACWLKFRSGLGMLSLFFFVGSKSNASAFFWLCFRMAWVFLGVPKATHGWGTFSLFLWGSISLFLGVPKATFRDFWGCTPAMVWTQNLLGLCLFGCAPDAAFLGFAWWPKFRSGWGTISLFLGVPKATFRDFWGCTPAMAWTQNLLGLWLFGCASDAAFLAGARFHCF